MLPIGVLGINFKTAELPLREAVARGASTLSGERAVFWPYPMVVLSTCNRAEIYFSADDLAAAHSALLAHLRPYVEGPFEHCLYSYFGIDCFAHLCRVTAGFDSAIFAETEIQRQVKVAYGSAKYLSAPLHYVFQKALKVGKGVRNQLDLRDRPTLYGTLWQLAEWQNRSILLVGYSEINRGLLSFLTHKGVENISLCTRSDIHLEGVRVCGRDELGHWRNYDVIVCASKANGYLISGQSNRSHTIFDLSVPRNVDPDTGATLYNIDQCIDPRGAPHLERCEALVREEVVKLTRIYLKTSRGSGRSSTDIGTGNGFLLPSSTRPV